MTPLIPSLAMTPSLLLVHIHNAPAGEACSADINSSSYCLLSDSIDECKIFAVYSQSIFGIYPAALLACMSAVLSLFSNYQWYLMTTIVETSWTLPLPFCSGQFDIDENTLLDVSDLHSFPYQHTVAESLAYIT